MYACCAEVKNGHSADIRVRWSVAVAYLAVDPGLCILACIYGNIVLTPISKINFRTMKITQKACTEISEAPIGGAMPVNVRTITGMDCIRLLSEEMPQAKTLEAENLPTSSQMKSRSFGPQNHVYLRQLMHP